MGSVLIDVLEEGVRDAMRGPVFDSIEIETFMPREISEHWNRTGYDRIRDFMPWPSIFDEGFIVQSLVERDVQFLTNIARFELYYRGRYLFMSQSHFLDIETRRLMSESESDSTIITDYLALKAVRKFLYTNFGKTCGLRYFPDINNNAENTSLGAGQNLIKYMGAGQLDVRSEIAFFLVDMKTPNVEEKRRRKAAYDLRPILA